MVCLQSFPRIMDAIVELLSAGSMMKTTLFYPDYYFPFFRGTGITTQESVVIERHADKESFAGACEI